MKTFEISVTKRKELGKKESVKLRKQLNVPCVLYGGEKNMHFYAHENAFKDLLYTPNTYIVLLDIEGEEYKAVLKDIQFHPVTDRPIHIDFVEVIKGKEVIINIPVELVGNSVGIRNGGKLRFNRRYLTACALEEFLPDTLKVDISEVTIGEAIYVRNLNYENLTLLDPDSASIMAVASSRVVAKGMLPSEEEMEAEGEAAEGEAAEGEAAEGETEESKE